jgi:hypothetical protein
VRAEAEKIGSSGDALTMTSSPWMIRPTANNRFDNLLVPYASGESGATPLGAPPDPIYFLR